MHAYMSVYTSISKFHDTYVAQTTIFQKYMHRLMHVKNPYLGKDVRGAKKRSAAAAQPIGGAKRVKTAQATSKTIKATAKATTAKARTRAR